MSADLSLGIRGRLPLWRSQLWQVYEGQYEPFGPGVLQRYLRTLLAYAHAGGLPGSEAALDSLSLRVAGTPAVSQEEVETEVYRILDLMASEAETAEDPPVLTATRVRLVPGRGFLDSSLDLVLVFQELAKLGHLEALPDLQGLPRWDDFDPQVHYLAWEWILVSHHGPDQVRDVLDFLASEPDLTLEIEENVPPERLRQVRTRVAPPPPPHPQESPRPGAAPGGAPRRATDIEGAAAENKAPGTAAGTGAASIRMSIERLDKIINSVGELVTAQGRLASVAGRLTDPGLEACAEEIERLTLALRDASIGLRLQPVGALFSRFSRLVRDLSQNLGKEVDFATEGEETEIDRSVIEKLYDPLVHLIRNSLDHGLEAPEVRQAAGKPPHGSVRLRAFQQGSEVVIQVADDGAGINPKKILAKAVEKGLVKADADLGPRQILDLIFLPGFSTAEKVSDVSGRGVGMDVVKSNVEALRGQIDIQSEVGQGSIFSLRFPLTLAIIDGLCVEVGGEKYILPQDPIEECLDLTRYDDGGKLALELGEGKQGLYYNLRGDGVSVFTLATVLNPGLKAGVGTRIIILRTFRGDRIALVVDAIVGRQQVVIKPLGPLHALRRELSGATILGDGTIALVLDLSSIVRRFLSGSTGGKTIVLG